MTRIPDAQGRVYFTDQSGRIQRTKSYGLRPGPMLNGATATRVYFRGQTPTSFYWKD